MGAEHYIYEAAYVAMQAHTGQVDKQGAPYIEHPRAVAEIVRRLGGTPEQIAAAWLHDVIEDCGFEAAQLHRFSPEIAVLVMLLTRSERETFGYAQYVAGLVGTPAALIKFADLTHNTDPSRGPIPERLAERYERAKAVLLGRVAPTATVEASDQPAGGTP